jgi:hypothetical protein
MIGLMHSALKRRHREPRRGVAIQCKGFLDCSVGDRLLAMTAFY